MVSVQEKFRSGNNYNCTGDGKGDVNGIDYDNLKLTKILMSSSLSSLSSSSSSSSTSTTLKSTERDLDAGTLEKLPMYRSTTTTPARSAVIQESITNSTTIEHDWGHTSAEILACSSRAYRIIDSDVSQKILQRLVADKLAAVQTTAGKGPRFLKRKGSNRGNSTFFFQRQSNFGSQIWNKSEELSLTSKTPIFRTNFDIVRTSSFNGNQAQIIRKHLDYNRNSLPINIISLNDEEVEVNRSSQKTTNVLNSQSLATRSKDRANNLQKMAVALDNLQRSYQHTSTILGANNATTTIDITTHQHYKNGASINTDDDPEAGQRLSFVSSSTGYSSARSSLRSSEISDDTVHSLNASSGKKLLTHESSLSEVRRLKLLNSGTITQLDRIAMELLETERSYVNDLNDIIQGYLNFLVDHREEFEMTVDDISNTFGCIERIFLFNKKLYHDLDAAQLSVVSMAKCLSDNMNGFNDYVMYCTKYQIMVETLSTLLKNKKIAETLKLRQAVLGHSLPLSAYLLKPVQRVLKYHLFLENILKASVEPKILSDSDRAIILQALRCMTSQAEKINEEKKRVEHLERVRELQNALHKWCIDEKEDLSKYGDLLLEATFKLAGAKTNRQLFLFEEMLLIVKERNGALICKDYIMCSSLMLNESISIDPLAFQVLSYDNLKIQYVFLASNMDQKRHWMKELKRMMLDHYAVQIPEKTKMLMLSLSDDCSKSTSFALNVKGNKKVPKYLEKRRKSIDANQTFRRSHARKRSSSGSKNILKASSTGNLTKETGTCQEAHVPLKASTRFWSFNNDNKPTTSTSVENGYEYECAEVSGRSAAFQSLFLKKKNGETRRKKSSCELKNNFVSRLPSSILKECRTKKSSETVPDTVNKQQQNYRCQCLMMDSNTCMYSVSQPSCPHPSSSCCAQKHFDDTMALLYGELQLLMKNAENLNSFGESDSKDDTRRKIGSRSEAAIRLDALANECRAAECSVSCDFALESEDGDEPKSIPSWIESPHISEKFHGLGSCHNVHHRRRSSQVAEQVWRLRHKQAKECKNNENNTDKKLPISSIARTEVLSKDAVTGLSKSLQPMVSIRNTKGFDHRYSIARQRTPLTVEQCAELDGELDSNSRAVKKMIKELEIEKPGPLITSHQHAI
ncbi:Pleckstrin [Dirofilaria immitis]